MRIAILDSEPTLLDEIQGAFNDSIESGDIRFCENALDLLDAVKSTYFDVVIMEHKSFDLNKTTEIVLLWLRQYGLTTFGKHTHVIMVSDGIVSSNDELYCLGLGADDYFNKPVSTAKLILKLKNHLKVKKEAQAIQDEFKSFFAQNVHESGLEKSSNKLIQNVSVKQSVKEIKLVQSQMVMGYCFNYKEKRVTLPTGEEVRLSDVLFRIALFFLTNVGVPLSKDSILLYSKVKGSSSKNLSVYICMFKKSLKLNEVSNLQLHSIYGYGYKLKINKLEQH